ncbi:type IV-A pilus assembly ATPase PilB [Candidatus Omnitrophus magneticus]|uniref:Type IV-A pilus assembly ATPase PilB n=1 Tax=Candidatus Omnitrophus magneticus TaxID=1609969 RepID=A0A0F0CVY3_9BACT|nr:type IV-A pilus assembly ATPase PilB [Candidatus Omnitrophus magneticus]
MTEQSLKNKFLNTLKENGYITEQVPDSVLSGAKNIKELLDYLYKTNILDKEQALGMLSEISGLAVLDISRIKISPETIAMVPKRVAYAYEVIPVSKLGNILTVAKVDPSDIIALDDIKAVTKCMITCVLADSADVKEALIKYYERSINDEISSIVEKMDTSNLEMVESKNEDDGVKGEEILKIIAETPVVKLTNTILRQAVLERASDIFVEPLESNFRVRYRIDGILRSKQLPPKKYHAAVISRLKVMANLDIAERRLPQDGRFKIRVEDRFVDFRLSIIPSVLGEKATLRVLDKTAGGVDIKRLGFSSLDLEVICSASAHPHGLILACGPTGSGKTTTLYSILKYIDNPSKNLVTVEDPVEYEFKGINQVLINEGIKLTFAAALRSILRQDPDVIMIGEIRDFETVDIAVKAALTGHLVLSTLHTNTASATIVRLLNMGVEPFLINSSVLLIVAQRLVRKLCDSCKVSYTPSMELAKTHKINNGDSIPIIYRPKGCEKCLGTGYKGRIVIAECLGITPAIKTLIFKKASETEIELCARGEGMITMRESGIQNVLSGITSLEEVLAYTAAPLSSKKNT